MTAKLLLIDNYDSFTYNLAQAFMELGAEVAVHRNDAITIDEARALKPTHVCISPGPGHPKDAGVSLEALDAFLGKLPVLGVCLGHQAMAYVSGATVGRAPRLMHGKSSDIFHDSKGLYEGLPHPVQVARYHSLIVDESTLPPSLVRASYTREGELMGMRHTSGLAFGVQFHPESVLTPRGNDMLANFLRVRA